MSHINYYHVAQLTCSFNIFSPNCMNMPCNCWHAQQCSLYIHYFLTQ